MRSAKFTSNYSLPELRRLLSAAAAEPDLRAGTWSKLAGEVSETGVCLRRRQAAPESSVEFRGVFRTEGSTVLIDGVYATDSREVLSYAVLTLSLLVLALAVVGWAMGRGSAVSVVFGSVAAAALAILGWKLLRFYRSKAMQEAEALDRILRSIVGADGG